MKKFKKIFAWVSILSLVLQISGGIFVYRPVLAQEEIPPETTVEEVSPPAGGETPQDPIQTEPEETPTIEVTPTETPSESPVDPNLVVSQGSQAVIDGGLDLDSSGTEEESAQLNPSISTDKEDYAPEETVTISGNNFPVNTTLLIKVTRPDGSVVKGDGSFAEGSDEITTDAEGKFTYLYILDGIEGEYRVEVFQGGTVLATMTFTDSRTTVSATLNGSSSVTVAPGASITAAVTGTLTSGDDWKGTQWRIATTAPGSMTCEDTGDHNSNGTFTETFTITAPSTAGTYNAYFLISGKDNCSGQAGSLLTLSNAVKVVASNPDLTVTKTNDKSGQVNVNQDFKWIFHITNNGTARADFDEGETILTDNLPSNDSAVSYGTPTVDNLFGITKNGDIVCSIDSSENFTCKVSTGSGTRYVHIDAGGSFDVSFIVTPISVGTLINPRSGGSNKCQVDPEGKVSESDENNNTCSDTVTVASVPQVTNPPLPPTCGLDIALVLDSSGSISSSELTQMKNAFHGFVNALLPGTPTQFSVTDFDTIANVLQGFTGDATIVNSAINSPSSGGSTNWENGLLKAQSTLPNRTNFDLVIFASDGNPNTVDNGTSVPEAQAVAEAVLVANSIKSGGARILALGIGDQLDVNNLKAISGPNQGTTLNDDVVITDFANLATLLAAFASQTCGGTITVNKYIDQVDPNSRGGEGWMFNVSGPNSYSNNLGTDANGQDTADDLTAGAGYSIVETGLLPGHSFGSAVCRNQAGAPEGSSITNGVGSINVSETDIISCDFVNITQRCGDGIVNQTNEQCDDGNNTPGDGCSAECQIEYGSIALGKCNDLNGDGGECMGDEPMLPGWTLFLDENGDGVLNGDERSGVTDSQGMVNFSNVLPRSYGLCEVEQPGWIRTKPQASNCQGVALNPGGSLAFYFANYLQTPSISLTKSNDKSGGASAGDTVNYTLTLTNGPVALPDVTVTDVMPSGFVYVAGSGQVDSAFSEPTISGNVLTWTLSFVAEQVRTITYQAKIDGSQPTGTYYNLATCYGSTGGELAIARFEPLTAECDVVDSSVPIGAGVSTTTAIGGTVLGISTVLGAATGSETYWLILALLMILAGVTIMFMSKKRKALLVKKLNQFSKKLSIFATMILALFLFAGSAQAVVMVKMADLPAYERGDNFKVYYTALDTENPSVSVVAYVKKDGGFGWKTFGGTKTDYSGYFEAFGSDLDGDGSYHFYVQANGVDSSETSTTVDRVAPNGPGDYRKSRESSTSYKIHFKNPGELDYGWTRIFASTEQNFMADDATKKADVGGGPNQEFDYVVTGLEPDKEYYFALQGFDKAGNGSGLSGDGGSVTYEEIPGEAVGGEEVVVLPMEEVQEGEILGEEVPVEEAPAEEGMTGLIGGAATQIAGTNKGLLAAGVGALLVLAGLGYYFYRKRAS